jgi:protein-disulfide isomerase
MPKFAFSRRSLLLATAAATFTAACNGSNGGAAASAGDMAIGAENAPVTLIEYASVTCPHCREFHDTVWDSLKEHYIDTGKVRFIFREFPTPPQQVAVAGFQLARCGGATPDQYFTRLDALFGQQVNIYTAMESGGAEAVRSKLIEIGGATGLSADQVTACIADEAGAERIRQTVETGQSQFNVTGTPTLILNGEKVTDPSAVTYEGLSRLIDAKIAAH